MKLHKLTALVGTLLMAINVSAKPLEFLVPAYFYPAGEALKDWKQLAETAKSVPVNVIINPGFYLNGTRTLDANYIDVVKLLHKGGAKVIGYISTSYDKRPTDERKKDVDAYLSLYQADGFFYDEMTNDSDLTHLADYAAVYSYIKSRGKRLRVFGNPGVSVPGQDVYLTMPCVDTLVNYEYFGAGYRGDGTHSGDYRAEDWLKNFTSDHFAHILHTEAKRADMKTDIALASKRGAGFIYITDSTYTDLHTNPYDRLPSYWKEETVEVFAERKRH